MKFVLTHAELASAIARELVRTGQIQHAEVVRIDKFETAQNGVVVDLVALSKAAGVARPVDVKLGANTGPDPERVLSAIANDLQGAPPKKGDALRAQLSDMVSRATGNSASEACLKGVLERLDAMNQGEKSELHGWLDSCAPGGKATPAPAFLSRKERATLASFACVK